MTSASSSAKLPVDTLCRAALGAQRNCVSGDSRYGGVADEPRGALKGAIGERLREGEQLVEGPAKIGAKT